MSAPNSRGSEAAGVARDKVVARLGDAVGDLLDALVVAQHLDPTVRARAVEGQRLGNGDRLVAEAGVCPGREVDGVAGLGLANRVLHSKVTPPLPKDVRRRTIERLRDDLRRAGAVLGLLERDPTEYLTAHRSRRVAARGLDQARIEQLVADRESARRGKDFARADSLRAELLTLGVEVMDTPAGPRWRVQD